MNILRNRIAIFVVFSLISLPDFCKAQIVDDWQLVAGQDFHDHSFDKRHVRFLFPKSKNALIRYNPLSLTAGSLMYFYQGIVSFQVYAECPYQISCSNFSKEAIKEYGFVKGISLTADRLMRCNRLAGIDLHPLDFDRSNKIIDNLSRYHFE